MKPLILNIIGDSIEAPEKISYISGSKGYYTAEFAFDNDWDKLIPHIVVYENGVKRADEVIIDNTHQIPTTESGVMQVGVYGLNSEGKKCISTGFVSIAVGQGAYTGVIPLPKDIWDGYQITVLGYVERAEAAANSVKDFTVSAVSGSEANVKKTETETGIHYEFTLPQGEQGARGPKGDKGDKGDSYILTASDKTEIEGNISAEIEDELNAALEEIVAIQEELMIPDGNEVAY